MNDAFSALRPTTIDTGNSVTVLVRDKDRLSNEHKASLSLRVGKPVQFVFQERDACKKEWWYQGINYNPYGPAVTSTSPYSFVEAYHLTDGNKGNKHGPSFVSHQYNVKYQEKWEEKQGILHRDEDLPAYTVIDYANPPSIPWEIWKEKTRRSPNLSYNYPDIRDYFGNEAKITHMTEKRVWWYKHGVCTRESSWASQKDLHIAERIAISGTIGVFRTTVVRERQLVWFDQRGERHRVDGPALISFTNVKEAQVGNKEGPWKYDGWKGEWYIHGEQIKTLDIIEWAKRNRIKMLGEACHDKSAFRDADGEFCFLTDFLGF